MDLSLKILDPENNSIIDIGQFQFLGTEDEKAFKAQIIDLDNNENPYYIGAGGTADIVFPDGISVVADINSNRSIISVILDDAQLTVMKSGGLTVNINDPSIKIAQLGNSVRRLIPIEGGTESSGSATGKAKTTEDDDTAGYLTDELVAGPGVTITETDNAGDKVLTISADSVSESLTNNSGSTLLQGRIVKTSAAGISYADNTALNNSENIAGITLEEIDNGNAGSVATDGTVTLTVAGANNGDSLYLDGSSGQITTTAPTTPGTVVFKIGTYNVGKIYLRFELVGVN